MLVRCRQPAERLLAFKCGPVISGGQRRQIDRQPGAAIDMCQRSLHGGELGHVVAEQNAAFRRERSGGEGSEVFQRLTVARPNRRGISAGERKQDEGERAGE